MTNAEVVEQLLTIQETQGVYVFTPEELALCYNVGTVYGMAHFMEVSHEIN